MNFIEECDKFKWQSPQDKKVCSILKEIKILHKQHKQGEISDTEFNKQTKRLFDTYSRLLSELLISSRNQNCGIALNTGLCKN